MARSRVFAQTHSRWKVRMIKGGASGARRDRRDDAKCGARTPAHNSTKVITPHSSTLAVRIPRQIKPPS